MDKWWSRYIGIPHDEVNCWELVRMVYSQELGIELPEIGVESHSDFYSSNIQHWKESAPKEYSVGLFRTSPFHVGIFLDKTYMLHSKENNFVCRQAYDTSFWRKKLIGWYSLEGTHND